MTKKILITASILGIVSIILGAFGAHGLKQLITLENQQAFETGVRYQMYHAILLLFLGTTSLIQPKTKKVMYYLVILGVLFFSGSIYGLATNTLTTFDFKSIGFVTPIGGLSFILAWSFMFVDFLNISSKKGN
ncbi:DUF423 domain-containing protein [Flaviramulus aquimarinus]|uniref:DUF423 domain-containing protein n=1 Tax=Flaviramulus aquimarinus TaxID=1170456 RepID=A0ABP9EXQ9_9FLAO